MAKHELTNAQWRVFMEESHNIDVHTLAAPATLKEIVKGAYGISDDGKSGPAYLHAWMNLFARNKDVLRPLFPTKEGEEFDPRAVRADVKSIPAGTEITIPRLLGSRSAFELDGTIKAATEKADWARRPADEISWLNAFEYCLWAGFHIPFEAEWAHAARGAEGRRFAWGNEWDAERAWFGNRRTKGVPTEVDGDERYRAENGLMHLAGNVNEWVYEPLRVYPGHSAEHNGEPVRYKTAGHSMLARGGSYAFDDYTMLAADRIWDATNPLAVEARIASFGFRPAAYSLPMRDYTEMISYELSDATGKGPAKYLPRPMGLKGTQKESAVWTGTAGEDVPPLFGFAPGRTAGVLIRDLQDGSGSNHVYAVGPAKGIGFLPIHGIPSGALKSGSSLRKLAEDENNVCFVGVLVGTPNAQVRIVDEAGLDPLDDEGRPVKQWLSFANDENEAEDKGLWLTHHKFGHRYPVGAFVVLRGDRVALYPANGEQGGTYGGHIRTKGSRTRPAQNYPALGYLPGDEANPAWTDEWKQPIPPSADGATGPAGGEVVLTTFLPRVAITKKGAAPSTNAREKGATLSLRLEVRYTDE